MKSNQKNYLTLGFVMIFLAGFVFFALAPIFNGINKSAKDSAEVKKEIASLDLEINNLGTINQQYQQYQADFDKINSLFINLEIPVDFIRFLEKLSQDSKVSAKISSVTNAPDKKDEQSWPSLYFQTSAKGSFLNLSRFLEKLENAPYLIEIQNLNISKIEDQKSGKDVQAEFSIKVFAK
jgi:Tfp pilus assembly protein PilO